jgi:hypothetical protein
MVVEIVTYYNTNKMDSYDDLSVTPTTMLIKHAPICGPSWLVSHGNLTQVQSASPSPAFVLELK